MFLWPSRVVIRIKVHQEATTPTLILGIVLRFIKIIFVFTLIKKRLVSISIQISMLLH